MSADNQPPRDPPAVLGGRIDPWELAAGLFVVVVALQGPGVAGTLFSNAAGIVVAQAAYELPMAILAVCAGKAVLRPTRLARAMWLTTGVIVVGTVGTIHALELATPSAVMSGALLIWARVKVPAGRRWFDAEHCLQIERVAAAAWSCLIAAFAILAVSTSLFEEAAGTSTWLYAAVWGGYYLVLSLLLPWVRSLGLRRNRRMIGKVR